MLQPDIGQQADELRDSLLYDRRKNTAEVRRQVFKGFLENSRELKLGEKVPIRIGCPDERAFRAVPEDPNNSEDFVYLNLLGGGWESTTDEDIKRFLAISNGIIDIYAHTHCGWGQLKFNEFLFNTAGENSEDGRERVLKSIGLALENQYFTEKIQQQFDLDEQSLDTLLEKSKAYVERKYQEGTGQNMDHKDEHVSDYEHTLFQQAFSYGKALKLRNRFYDVYNSMKKDGVDISSLPPENEININVHLDDLDGEPHNHIANDAVVNFMGAGEDREKRFITSRFLVNDKKPFFADVTEGNILPVIALLFKIMEGDHSDTAGTKHYVHVFIDDPRKMRQISLILDSLIDYDNQDDPTRKIVYHLITKEDIENASPLPRAV